MSPRSATAFLALACPALFAADAPPDLKDFRTVATAKTATIEKTGVTAGGRPGYLGVEFTSGDSAAPIVAGVEPGSPAQTSGILLGDLISKVGTTDVQNARAFRETVQSLGENATVPLRLTRAGKPLDLTVQLAAASRPKVLPEHQPILGFRLSDRTEGDGLVAAPSSPPRPRDALA